MEIEYVTISVTGKGSVYNVQFCRQVIINKAHDSIAMLASPIGLEISELSNTTMTYLSLSMS